MRFGAVTLADAEGAVLAHALKLGDGSLAKGHALSPADIDRLRSSGIESVIAVRLDTDDLTEDEAASRLAAAFGGDHHQVVIPPFLTGPISRI